MQTYKIFQYDEYGYYTGESRDITMYDPIPKNWTEVALPEIPKNHYARYYDRRWIITDQPKPVLTFPEGWQPGGTEEIVPSPETTTQTAPEVI